MSAGDFNAQFVVAPGFWDAYFRREGEQPGEDFMAGAPWIRLLEREQRRRAERAEPRSRINEFFTDAPPAPPFSWADAAAVIRVNVSDWSQFGASISPNPASPVHLPDYFDGVDVEHLQAAPLEDLTGDNREEL
jgi:hypothetical protein